VIEIVLNATEEEPSPPVNVTFNFTIQSPANMTYMKDDLTENLTLRLDVYSSYNISSCNYSVDGSSGSLSEYTSKRFRIYLNVSDMSGSYEVTFECASEEGLTNSSGVFFTVYPDFECTSSSQCDPDEICSGDVCIELVCDCGYAENHDCVYYECCEDSDCDDDKEECDGSTHTCEPVECPCPEKISNHACNMGPDYCCSSMQCGEKEVCDTSANECIERTLSFSIPESLSVGQEISIFVFDQNSEPVDIVKIIVKYPDTDPLVDMEYYTDVNGRVDIPILHAGRVEFVARKGGYYLSSQDGEVPEPMNIFFIIQIVILIAAVAGIVVVYFKFLKGKGLGGIGFGKGPLKLDKTVSGGRVMLIIKNTSDKVLEGITIRDSVPTRSFVRSRLMPKVEKFNQTTDVLTWEIIKLDPKEEVDIEYETRAVNKGFSVMHNGKEYES